METNNRKIEVEQDLVWEMNIRDGKIVVNFEAPNTMDGHRALENFMGHLEVFSKMGI